MALATPLNNFATTLAADHAAGSGTLVLAPGAGAAIDAELARLGAAALSPTAPVRVTVARRSTLVNGLIGPGTTRTIFEATGKAGDTLTGCTAAEGTADAAYARNDPAGSLYTAGQILAIIGALAGKAADADVVKKAVAGTITAVHTRTAKLVHDGRGATGGGHTYQTVLADDVSPVFDFGISSTPQPGFNPNPVHAQGWNLDGANQPLDPAQCTCRYAMEGNFWNVAGIGTYGQGEYTFECHLPEAIYPDLFSFRPLSILIGKASKKATANFAVSTFGVLTEPGVQMLGLSWNGTSQSFFISAGDGSGQALEYGGNASTDIFRVGRNTRTGEFIVNGASSCLFGWEIYNPNPPTPGSVVKYSIQYVAGGLYYNGPDGQSFALMQSGFGFWVGMLLGVGGDTSHFFSPGAVIDTRAPGPGYTPLRIQADATPAVDTLPIYVGSTLTHRFGPAGYPIHKRTTAPADADLSAGEMALWLDQTPGATKLMVKAKDSGGTVRTGSVSLA